MSLSTTESIAPLLQRPDRLAPVNLADVAALTGELQPESSNHTVGVQPEAAETTVLPVLLTEDELVDQQYEEYLEDRFAHYGS